MDEDVVRIDADAAEDAPDDPELIASDKKGKDGDGNPGILIGL